MDLRPPRGMLDLLAPEGRRMRALYDRVRHPAVRALVVTVLNESDRSVVGTGDVIARTYGRRQ